MVDIEKTKGSCLCGKTTYAYSGDPGMKVLCHCLTCRKLTGSTHSTCFLVPMDKFDITDGTPKKTETTHENGMPIEAFFCGDCGTPLYKVAHADAFKGAVIVMAGTIDNLGDHMDVAEPGAELWVKYRAGWLGEVKGAQQLQEFA